MGRAFGVDQGHERRGLSDVRRQIEGPHLTVAIDTNVVVRVLVNDDERQAAIARRLLSRDLSLLGSVMMESEWVLRPSYGWSRARIADSFKNLLDLPTLRDAPADILWVIDRYTDGADFADMLHLAGANSASGSATFDQSIAKQVGPHSRIQIEMFA